MAALRVITFHVKQSTGHTHTGHTDRENTPDTGTHTRTTRPPNEHLPQALINAQRWRDDGACHLPRPGDLSCERGSVLQVESCRRVRQCDGVFLLSPEPRMRLAVRGVPKVALRTHSCPAGSPMG